MRSHLVDVAVISLAVAALVLLNSGDATDSKIRFHLLETLLPRIESLVQQLDRHWEYVRSQTDPVMERRKRAHEFLEILTGQLEERARSALGDSPTHELVDAVYAGTMNPYSAARMLLDDPAAMGALLSKAAEG